MNYNDQLPCLYCDTPTPRHLAREHTCPACWKRNEREHGPKWHQEDWHRLLLPDYTKFVHDSKILNRSASIEGDSVDFAAEDVTESAHLAPVRHQAVYQAIYTLHTINGLGCRRIKARLGEMGVKPSVDLATVKRYLALVKRQIPEVPISHK